MCYTLMSGWRFVEISNMSMVVEALTETLKKILKEETGGKASGGLDFGVGNTEVIYIMI